jgi:ABC-type Fe3+-siderophore transport system permease subunit
MILINSLVNRYILGLSSRLAFGYAIFMSFIDLPQKLSAFVFAFISVSVCYFYFRKI